MKLLLVRHGQTEFNATFKFSGSTDLNLSSTGYKQMVSLSDRLACENIDTIYSSDLKRARVSAEIINYERKAEIETFPELREINYGYVEGLSFSEINQRFPDVAASIIKHDNNLSFPKGERFMELKTRVQLFHDSLRLIPAHHTILIVSHGGTLRMLLCLLLETSLDLWWKINLENASLSTIEINGKCSMLSLLNDTSHLQLQYNRSY